MNSEENSANEQSDALASFLNKKKTKKSIKIAFPVEEEQPKLVTHIEEEQEKEQPTTVTHIEESPSLNLISIKKKKKSVSTIKFESELIKEEDIFSENIPIYRSDKEIYKRDGEYIPFFDPKFLRNRVGGKVTKEKTKEQIREEKSHLADTFDLFNNSAASVIRKEIEEEEHQDIMDESIKLLNELVNDERTRYVVYDNKAKSLPLGAVSFSRYKEDIIKYYSFATPSERGMMIILMCFGGLISKSKFNGPIVKTAKLYLEILAGLLTNFQPGEEGKLDSTLYENAKKMISSELINGPYKTELSLLKQIENLSNLIRTLIKMKDSKTGQPLGVKFPVGYSHSHSGGSIVINGIPSYQDFINFYTNETVVKKENTKTKISTMKRDYDDEDEYDSRSNDRYSEKQFKSTVRENSSKPNYKPK